MKKLAFFAAFLAFSSLFAQPEKLVWSDEFDGTGGPDPDNWTAETGATGWGNGEIQFYTNLNQNAWLAGGALHIRAKNERGVWTSARLMSLGKREFRYGRFVFRARLPEGRGTWPSLWLLGTHCATDLSWPACGEIDVVEHVGWQPGVVSGAVQSISKFGKKAPRGEREVPTFSTDFHEWELDWTAEKIEIRLDGSRLLRYAPEVKTAENWPFDRPFFLLMNVAMGGTLGSDPLLESKGLKNGIDPDLLQATMEVDFIRVFEPDGDGKSDWPEGLRLSPNPDGGLFLANVPTGAAAFFELKNALGETVFSQKMEAGETPLDFTRLPSGAFFAHFLVGEKRFSSKILLP